MISIYFPQTIVFEKLKHKKKIHLYNLKVEEKAS